MRTSRRRDATDPHLLLVVTSQPVDPRLILRTATSRDAGLELDRLGVVVVCPEGFGPLALADRQRDLARAREAAEGTVAGLRRAGIVAAGHVGDHDPQRAVDDALLLFPAHRTVVFAPRRLAGAYRRRLGRRAVELVELPDEPIGLRARSPRP